MFRRLFFNTYLFFRLLRLLTGWGTIALPLLLGFASPGLAADIKRLPESQAQLFSGLYPVFPAGTSQDAEQPGIQNPTPWQIRIWGLNEADECTHDNQRLACRGFTLFISVSDDGLGGKTAAFRTRKAFHWAVIEIRQREQSGGRDCVLFTLRERIPSTKSKGRWEHKDLSVCVSPSGVQP